MDQLFYNGIFHTMNPEQPLAQAILAREGRIVAVGTEAELRAQAENPALYDLSGAAVYPGFVDSHLHILNLAVTSRQLELNNIRSRRVVLDAVTKRAESFPEGSFLRGRGFNEDLWDDDSSPITRRDLDLAAPKHAVCLTRVCGHMAVANSLAMEQLGVTADTKAPEGGELDWENGIFRENALNLLTPENSDAGVEACKDLLYQGMSMAADAGLTAIYTDDFGAGGFSMETVVAAYRALEQEGRMPVRVVQQCALPDDASWQAFHDAGFAYGQGSDTYRIGPRKLYADGSLGARTACVSVPYADAPDRRGVPIYSQEELNRLAVQTHRAGMPFIVHAIGDAAARSVLDAIACARATVPGTDSLPDGIVHCQITTKELLERIAKEKVNVYAQPVFVEYDLHICRDRVGAELEKTSYNWKTLLHSGVCISSGSDCPVEPLHPAKNIYCAVTRKDFDGKPEGGWLPEQKLTVAEAVECHTLQAAKAVGYEDRAGRIAPGCLADLSVFPLDFEAIAPDEILNQKPVMTVVGGRVRLCGK